MSSFSITRNSTVAVQLRSVVCGTAIAMSMLMAGSISGMTNAAQAADYIAGIRQIQPQPDTVCAQQSVLKRISAGFDHQVRNVPNLPIVQISAVSNIYQTRYEPKTYDSGVTRHYCSATAVLSNGENHSLWYLVEDEQGFASIGKNVEFCINGFDKWYVYNGRCRVLR